VVDEWFAMVQDNTRRNLTQSGGILIALGALAKEHHDKQRHLVKSCVASLWKGALLEGLVWHASTHGQPDDNSEPSIFSTDTRHYYDALSWSWASCGRPITFRIDKESDLVMRGKSEEPK
jgi:hypothetical protein